MRTRTRTRTRVAEAALALAGIILMGVQLGDDPSYHGPSCEMSISADPTTPTDPIRGAGLILIGLAAAARPAADRHARNRAADASRSEATA